MFIKNYDAAVQEGERLLAQAAMAEQKQREQEELLDMMRRRGALASALRPLLAVWPFMKDVPAELDPDSVLPPEGVLPLFREGMVLDVYFLPESSAMLRVGVRLDAVGNFHLIEDEKIWLYPSHDSAPLNYFTHGEILQALATAKRHGGQKLDTVEKVESRCSCLEDDGAELPF